jgi:uncharacterized iron-regulated membrane protein
MPTLSTPANKNWLLAKVRKWHSWGGLFLSGFILLVAVTGILLNHKDLIFHKGENKSGPTGLLRSTMDVSTVPITFDRALQLAKGHYGDVPLEKIELKDEHGQLLYKIARGEGEEIRIDAQTGEMTSKYGMNLAADGTSMLNWAKIVDDLHTGKIFGTTGKLTIDLTSGVIIALTFSGIYLWGAPILRKRQNAKARVVNGAVVSRRIIAAPTPDAQDDETASEAREFTSSNESANHRKHKTAAILEAARRRRSLVESQAE